MLPLSAFGHGGQFFLAKFSEPSPGRLHLEVTADYGANPMLGGEDDAAIALTEILQVRSGGELKRLDQVATPRFEKRADADPSSPLPQAPKEPGVKAEVHQMLAVVWDWPRTAGSVAFEIPQGNPHNVIFWRIDPQTQQPSPQWCSLIAGDRTPELVLAAPAARWPKWSLAALGLVCGVAVWARRRYLLIVALRPKVFGLY